MMSLTAFALTDGRGGILHRQDALGSGTPLTLGYDANPDEVAMHVGTFDDPTKLEPRQNYGSSHRLGWVCCGIDLSHRDTEERW